MEPGEAEVSTETVRAWLGDLGRLAPTDDGDRVDPLRALEQLKSAMAAAQARFTAPSPVAALGPGRRRGSRRAR